MFSQDFGQGTEPHPSCWPKRDSPRNLLHLAPSTPLIAERHWLHTSPPLRTSAEILIGEGEFE